MKQQEAKMLQLIDKSEEVTVRAGLQRGGNPHPGRGGTAMGPPSSPHCLPLQRLQEEVTQLKRSLQRAETEAKVLWEEMRGQEAKGVSAHVQERVLLRQEVGMRSGLWGWVLLQALGAGRSAERPSLLRLQVDKLRLLLLEKEDENVVVSGNYLEQVWGRGETFHCSLFPGLCPYGLPPLQVRGLELRLSHAQKMLRNHEELRETVKEVRWSRHLCSRPSGSCSSTSNLLTLLLFPRSCCPSLRCPQSSVPSCSTWG